MLCFTECS